MRLTDGLFLLTDGRQMIMIYPAYALDCSLLAASQRHFGSDVKILTHFRVLMYSMRKRHILDSG